MLTLNKFMDYFAALTKFIILLTLSKSKKLVAFSNSTGYLGYLPLTLQYLCDLWDAMPMLVTSYFPPTFLLWLLWIWESNCYCLFYLTLLCAFFKGFPGARSSTSARLHADLRNIVPAQLLASITPIHNETMLVISI